MGDSSAGNKIFDPSWFKDLFPDALGNNDDPYAKEEAQEKQWQQEQSQSQVNAAKRRRTGGGVGGSMFDAANQGGDKVGN